MGGLFAYYAPEVGALTKEKRLLGWPVTHYVGA